jgi:benzoyl-CoA reductase/2-hydroxyglutaryl-CoA dehydratase subunit BcrC/BadD/HgdB
VASTAFVVEGPNGERKDLAELDDEQLKEFAAVAEVTVGDRLKGDKLRTAIVKALKD